MRVPISWLTEHLELGAEIGTDELVAALHRADEGGVDLALGKAEIGEADRVGHVRRAGAVDLHLQAGPEQHARRHGRHQELLVLHLAHRDGCLDLVAVQLQDVLKIGLSIQVVFDDQNFPAVIG